MPVSNVPCCEAAYNGKLEELKQMVESNYNCVNVKDEDARTCIFWAISGKNIEVVKFVLNQNVNVAIEDDSDWTPLHIAASAGLAEIVDLLLKKDKRVDVNAQTNMGQTPLHYIASKNHLAAAALLLEHPDIDCDIKNSIGETALHRAVACGNEAMVSLIVKHCPSSVSIKDNLGNSCLHVACAEGHDEIVVFLVKQFPAALKWRNNDDKRPPHVATDNVLQLLTNLIPPEERN